MKVVGARDRQSEPFKPVPIIFLVADDAIAIHACCRWLLLGKPPCQHHLSFILCPCLILFLFLLHCRFVEQRVTLPKGATNA